MIKIYLVATLYADLPLEVPFEVTNRSWRTVTAGLTPSEISKAFDTLERTPEEMAQYLINDLKLHTNIESLLVVVADGTDVEVIKTYSESESAVGIVHDLWGAISEISNIGCYPEVDFNVSTFYC